jgi:hypothetical protein
MIITSQRKQTFTLFVLRYKDNVTTVAKHHTVIAYREYGGMALHFAVPLLLNLLKGVLGGPNIQCRHGEVRYSYQARNRTLVSQLITCHFTCLTIVMKGQYDFKLMFDTLITHQSKVCLKWRYISARRESYIHFSTSSSMCIASCQAFTRYTSKLSAKPSVKNYIIFYQSFHTTRTHRKHK